MKLLIDIGNTSAKLAIADAASMDIVHYERLHESWEDAIVRLVEDYKVEAIRLSTVAGRDSRLQAVLESIALPAIWLTVDYPCPVRSEEHTSELQSHAATLFPYTTLFRSYVSPLSQGVTPGFRPCWSL